MNYNEVDEKNENGIYICKECFIGFVIWRFNFK